MVRKKIFDITPPAGESEESPREFPQKIPILAKEPSSSVNKLIPLFAGIILLAAVVLSYFFIPPKVKIEIWPEQKFINETAIVVINTAKNNGNHITGEVAGEEKTVSQNFPATGTKLKLVKARGVIRVYNSYSASSQTLAATTRFVSDDGKLFRTPSRVVVPGGSYEGGKLVPGYIDIEVIADQPGEDYNINPSTFSIPGFVGTPKYTAFYAKSFEPMGGGLKKEVPQVTQEDLNKARRILAEKAATEAKAALKNSTSYGGYIIFDEMIVDKLSDFSPAAEAGFEADSFTAQAKAIASALVFKESDLKDFVKKYIHEKIPSEDKLIDSSLAINYLLESIDSAKPEISLKLNILAQSYSVYEETQIKDMVSNKNAEEVESIVKNLPRIEKARVEFWPFWADSAPGDQGSIDVVLHLD